MHGMGRVKGPCCLSPSVFFQKKKKSENNIHLVFFPFPGMFPFCGTLVQVFSAGTIFK